MMRPFRLGLTGSIGMGKTATARMFRDHGIAVWDADAVVQRLYDRGGLVVSDMAALCPGAVRDGQVDRSALKAWIAATEDGLARLEGLVHPFVHKDRAAFLDRAAERGDTLVVLDIPLLYETGAEADVDAVLVVTAPADVQRARVMARPGMTDTLFEALLSRQMPDAEKRARATYVIGTVTPDHARAEVGALIARLKGADDA
jgi:dephospho-CoA kinase